MRKLLLVLVTIAVVAAACGGDDVSVDISNNPLAQAIAAEMLEEDGDSNSPIATQEEADCFAGTVVNKIGADRLGALGVTVDEVGDIEDVNFTDSEIDTVIDALTGCIDLEAAIAKEFAEDFGEEAGACVAAGLGEELLKGLMKDGFSGDASDEPSEEFFQAFLDVAAKCDLPLGG